ncbi:MAG: HAD hydrolase-like protein, partial [Planctomycetota bacterium]
GVPVESILVVGDFSHDVEAGARAGAKTALLTNGSRAFPPPVPSAFPPVVPDRTLERLCDLMELLGQKEKGARPRLP